MGAAAGRLPVPPGFPCTPASGDVLTRRGRGSPRASGVRQPGRCAPAAAGWCRGPRGTAGAAARGCQPKGVSRQASPVVGSPAWIECSACMQPGVHLDREGLPGDRCRRWPPQGRCGLGPSSLSALLQQPGTLHVLARTGALDEGDGVLGCGLRQGQRGLVGDQQVVKPGDHRAHVLRGMAARSSARARSNSSRAAHRRACSRASTFRRTVASSDGAIRAREDALGGGQVVLVQADPGQRQGRRRWH